MINFSSALLLLCVVGANARPHNCVSLPEQQSVRISSLGGNYGIKYDTIKRDRDIILASTKKTVSYARIFARDTTSQPCSLLSQITTNSTFKGKF